MSNQEILERIRKLSDEEKRNISYEELINIIDTLSPEEIIELSNIIGYPVFTRLCMGKIRHKFVLLQDGAAAIILNDKKQILLQQRSDNDKWGLIGGCQELGERFEETIIREIKEETNLDVKEENLQLISIVSGNSRRKQYPNGDIVINNTVLYLVKEFEGIVKMNSESKNIKFFDIENLPSNLHDIDLIEKYIEYKNKRLRQ